MISFTREDLTKFIIEYLEGEYNFPSNSISDNSDLRRDLNLDSLGLMDLIYQVSCMTELDLCADDINQCNTIADFVTVCMDREIEWRR